MSDIQTQAQLVRLVVGVLLAIVAIAWLVRGFYNISFTDISRGLLLVGVSEILLWTVTVKAVAP